MGVVRVWCIDDGGLLSVFVVHELLLEDKGVLDASEWELHEVAL